MKEVKLNSAITLACMSFVTKHKGSNIVAVYNSREQWRLSILLTPEKKSSLLPLDAGLAARMFNLKTTYVADAIEVFYLVTSANFEEDFWTKIDQFKQHMLERNHEFV
jgi:hypothetical protein